MVAKLNLGCHCFKLDGFCNIDIDPEVKPDMLLDLKHLSDCFDPNTIDFIHAGHILEHMPSGDALKLLNDCFTILKPCCSMLVIVPNYEIATKVCEWPMAEKVILANGDHKQIYNDKKLLELFKASSFTYFYNIGINNIPYMIYSDRNNPMPDPWQSTMLAIKL